MDIIQTREFETFFKKILEQSQRREHKTIHEKGKEHGQKRKTEQRNKQRNKRPTHSQIYRHAGNKQK